MVLFIVVVCDKFISSIFCLLLPSIFKQAKMLFRVHGSIIVEQLWRKKKSWIWYDIKTQFCFMELSLCDIIILSILSC